MPLPAPAPFGEPASGCVTDAGRRRDLARIEESGGVSVPAAPIAAKRALTVRDMAGVECRRHLPRRRRCVRFSTNRWAITVRSAREVTICRRTTRDRWQSDADSIGRWRNFTAEVGDALVDLGQSLGQESNACDFAAHLPFVVEDGGPHPTGQSHLACNCGFTSSRARLRAGESRCPT